MLHFLTGAPLFVVRHTMSLVDGFFEEAPENAPLWGTAVVHVHPRDAMTVINALKDWRFEGRKPARQAYSDPTFALAAAAIERESGGGTPAPASLWVRDRVW